MGDWIKDPGRVPVAHVIPSLEIAQVSEFAATAQNLVPFHATALQFPKVFVFGRVRAVQVTPSEEVAAELPEEQTAVNTVPFHATLVQFADAEGIVCSVHVTPSGEVDALETTEEETAQKIVPFQLTLRQVRLVDIV